MMIGNRAQFPSDKIEINTSTISLHFLLIGFNSLLSNKRRIRWYVTWRSVCQSDADRDKNHIALSMNYNSYKKVSILHGCDDNC